MSEHELAPKVLTPLGSYEPIQWEGVNTSGLKPIGDTVLVLPDQPSEKVGSLYMTDNHLEHLAAAAETGVIVDFGDGAWFWNADRSRRYEGTKPAIGQRVYFERYAGALPRGVDGRIYRLITDKQIGALAVDVEAPPAA